MTSFSSIFIKNRIASSHPLKVVPLSVFLIVTFIKNSYNISLGYSDLSKDFTEKLIHAHFIFKKLNFFLDNNLQGD